MKFVWIYGAQAAGKMTVGQELEKLTGFKLLHNHISIEFSNQFFPYSFGDGIGRTLVKDIRLAVFRAFAASNEAGVIFTSVKRHTEPHRMEYADEILNVFRDKGIECCFVELVADTEERLKRNNTPNRLAVKPSKSDVADSEKHFMMFEENYKKQPIPYAANGKDYLRIDNTNIAPEVAARMISEYFKL